MKLYRQLTVMFREKDQRNWGKHPQYFEKYMLSEKIFMVQKLNNLMHFELADLLELPKLITSANKVWASFHIPIHVNIHNSTANQT